MSSDNGQLDSTFLEINEQQLDKELITQPSLYFKYAKRLANARLMMDEAKAELEVTTGELDLAIREDPSKFGLPKATDKSVEAAIPTTKEYQKALSALNQAKHKAAILDAAVTALDHRKRALEKLVDLKSMEYWSEPRVSGEAGEALRDAKKHAIRNRSRGDD